ncbi:delta-60 repeat domain-containing protein [Cellulomonas sp. C5510]|uniref:delta-60 repeat domain-containing protein n=1 Tax=Cellulomonas sp. C5510 TaxID=2871170 RepID=UPI001C975F02|nr:delta-60 repeat domain-containing protein [Cellulomonas sp. C5510]QZN85385.1 delta-60 repeat domain-containing protein [Cellulomonas sp. C5510]
MTPDSPVRRAPAAAPSPAGRARARWAAALVVALVSVIGIGGGTAHAETTGMVLDQQFVENLGSGFDGPVSAITPLEDGGYLMGGAFSGYRGTPVGGIARLDADLQLDEQFNHDLGAGIVGQARQIVPMPDGGYLVVGTIFGFHGQWGTGHGILRLRPDLSLDTAFMDALGWYPFGPFATVRTALVEPDGAIVLGGEFTEFQGTPVGRLVRLTADLELDAAFAAATGTGFDGAVRAVLPAPEGGYLIAGSFGTYQGERAPRLALLDAGLQLSTPVPDDLAAVLDDPDAAVSALAPTGDGGYVAGGYWTEADGTPGRGLMRLDARLHRDTAWETWLGAGIQNSAIPPST